MIFQHLFKSKERCPVCGAKLNFGKIMDAGTYRCPKCEKTTKEIKQ